MEELKHANINSFENLEQAINRYNMLVSSYNLDQRIITNLTECNKYWLKHHESLENKSVNKIMELHDKIDKLEDIIRDKELTIEELEEQIEMYQDNPPEGGYEYDRD